MIRKVDWPKQSRFKPWFEKCGSSKKGSQKEPKKVTKIDASSVKNLDTDLDLPSVDTLLRR
jgi:hypothetical protein